MLWSLEYWICKKSDTDLALDLVKKKEKVKIEADVAINNTQSFDFNDALGQSNDLDDVGHKMQRKYFEDDDSFAGKKIMVDNDEISKAF